ncbi:Mitogen-activated protein kinase kinase kinase 3 [Diplonema papillatum]|nr:Mitogen-activated protein kinase kinase kinase 3 [Diplonema papillatum]
MSDVAPAVRDAHRDSMQMARDAVKAKRAMLGYAYGRMKAKDTSSLNRFMTATGASEGVTVQEPMIPFCRQATATSARTDPCKEGEGGAEKLPPLVNELNQYFMAHDAGTEVSQLQVMQEWVNSKLISHQNKKKTNGNTRGLMTLALGGDLDLVVDLYNDSSAPASSGKVASGSAAAGKPDAQKSLNSYFLGDPAFACSGNNTNNRNNSSASGQAPGPDASSADRSLSKNASGTLLRRKKSDSERSRRTAELPRQGELVFPLGSDAEIRTPMTPIHQHVALIVISYFGEVLVWNAALEDATGINEATAVGNEMTAFLPLAEDQAQLQCSLYEVSENPAKIIDEHTYTFTKADGINMAHLNMYICGGSNGAAVCIGFKSSAGEMQTKYIKWVLEQVAQPIRETRAAVQQMLRSGYGGAAASAARAPAALNASLLQQQEEKEEQQQQQQQQQQAFEDAEKSASAEMPRRAPVHPTGLLRAINGISSMVDRCACVDTSCWGPLNLRTTLKKIVVDCQVESTRLTKQALHAPPQTASWQAAVAENAVAQASAANAGGDQSAESSLGSPASVNFLTVMPASNWLHGVCKSLPTSPNTDGHGSSAAHAFPEPSKPQQSVAVTLNISRNVPEQIYTDLQRFPHAIAYLVTNAVRFSPKDGHVTVFVSLEQGGPDAIGNIVVQVCDQGVGLTPEILKAVEDRDEEKAEGLVGTMMVIEEMGGTFSLERNKVVVPECCEDGDDLGAESPLAFSPHGRPLGTPLSFRNADKKMSPPHKFERELELGTRAVVVIPHLTFTRAAVHGAAVLSDSKNSRLTNSLQRNQADEQVRREVQQVKDELMAQGVAPLVKCMVVESNVVYRMSFCHHLWERSYALSLASSIEEVESQLNSIDLLVIDVEEDIEIDELLAKNTDVELILAARHFDPSVKDARWFGMTLPVQTAVFSGILDQLELRIYRTMLQKKHIEEVRKAFGSVKNVPWERGRVLGKGSFGKVFEATNKLTGGKMAVKSIELRPDQCEEQLLAEVQLMAQLEHPNIVHYFYSELTKSELLIFMEFAADGTLASKIPKGGMSRKMISGYMEGVLRGLGYLHNHGITHRDIKAANVLLNNNVCKLTDFGTAKINSKSAMYSKMCISDADEDENETVGTMAFMAPEVFAGVSSETSADIWALGCMLMELATGQQPFAHKGNAVAAAGYVAKLKPDEKVNIGEQRYRYDPSVVGFLRECLKVDHSLRPGCDELLQTELIQGTEEALKRKATLVSLQRTRESMRHLRRPLARKRTTESPTLAPMSPFLHQQMTLGPEDIYDSESSGSEADERSRARLARQLTSNLRQSFATRIHPVPTKRMSIRDTLPRLGTC